MILTGLAWYGLKALTPTSQAQLTCIPLPQSAIFGVASWPEAVDAR